MAQSASELIRPGDSLQVSVVEAAPKDELPFRPGDRLRVAMLEDARVAYEGEVPATGRVPLAFIGNFEVTGLNAAACAEALARQYEARLYESATIMVTPLDFQRTEERTVRVLVSAGGSITVPYTGDLQVAGTTPAEVEKRIRALLREQGFVEPAVSVRVTDRQPGDVVVYGAVMRPGSVELPALGDMTVLQLLARVGGLSSWAKPEAAYIRRQSFGEAAPERVPVDLTLALKDPEGLHDIDLQSGDMLFVPSSNPRQTDILGAERSEVIIVGEVGSPGIITFAPGEERTLLRALLKAGGFGRFAKKDKVRLIRLNEEGKRTVQVIDAGVILDEGFLDRDIQLLPGDMLIVGEKMFSW